MRADEIKVNKLDSEIRGLNERIYVEVEKNISCGREILNLRNTMIGLTDTITSKDNSLLEVEESL